MIGSDFYVFLIFRIVFLRILKKDIKIIKIFRQ